MIGRAAVAIWCDIAFDVRDELNDWHTHEHMPERLAIPGFLRGSRWIADEGTGYLMLYEAENEAAITGGPYLERLNNPTPWSRTMMPHHRNMVRGPCRIEASFGAGLGSAMLTVRLSAPSDALRARLVATLAALPARKGLVAAALLHHVGSASGPLTAEQQLRGGDRRPDWVILVNGYSAEALAAVRMELNEAELPECVAGSYRLSYVLTRYTGRPEETA